MNKLVSNITIALILIFTQGLFFNNINFLGSINPFVYVFFIAYYPIKNNRTFFIICAFIYGLTGMSLAIIGMYYFMIQDWPMNIGGKPNYYMYQNIPAFIPITFEVTVLCTAHGMAITYLLRNKTLPGISAKNPDPRTSDDKFVMEINVSEAGMEEAELISELKDTGAIEINKA